jgi:arylsulfatase A-like enzyme
MRSFLACAVLGSLSVNLSAAEKPNIIFIMTDQQFADAMSCRMGNRYINTPVMDRLASQGRLFTRAYSPNPLSMPARSSIFTGRYTHTTGVQANDAGAGGWKGLTVMGTYFRNAGYETAYFGKWHLQYDKSNPGSHGFSELREPTRGKSEPSSPDTRVSELAVRFIHQKHDKPFLLVASYLNPHNICEYARRLSGRSQILTCGEIGDPPSSGQLPPPPFNLGPQLNEPDGMTLMRRGYQVEGGLFPVGRFDYNTWSVQRWGYYRMIEMVDAEIGKVMKALQSAGLEENTVIVFTSDHGECAGAHGWNQKTVFYEESVRVPLIISWKGKTVPGTSVNLVNTGTDILPTMLEFAGISKPVELPGLSLMKLSMGMKVNKWRTHVISENQLSQAGEIDGSVPFMEGRMVRSERFKYCIYSQGSSRESLTDMENDPGETRNLADDPAYKSTLVEHRELLRKFGVENRDTLAGKMLSIRGNKQIMN